MSAACPVFGFAVRLPPAHATDAARIFDALRADVLEPLGLLASPGGNANERIATGDGCQATDADRGAVIAWLERQAIADGFEVSILGDCGRAA